VVSIPTGSRGSFVTTYAITGNTSGASWTPTIGVGKPDTIENGTWADLPALGEFQTLSSFVADPAELVLLRPDTGSPLIGGMTGPHSRFDILGNERPADASACPVEA
jgi:hypothetical protein